MIPISIIIILLSLTPCSNSHSFSSRFLDSILQDHAFRSIPPHRPKTGVIYDGTPPSNLTGVSISALRLRTGSLRRRGYNGYKQFIIPNGVIEHPFVERVILVYHNLGNWSDVYYPLPGFVYLSPVVGLLGYNAVDLTAKDLPELDLRWPEDPVLIKFESLNVLPNGSSPVCVFFDLFGGVAFDKVANGSVCKSVSQGHFGLVVEDISPAPAPAPEMLPENPIAGAGGGGGRRGNNNNKGWWVGGSVAGGVLLVALVVVLVLWVRWCRGAKRIEKMTVAAERGDPLAVAAVGRAEVPVAMGTRTKPVLESEYVT